MRTPCWPRWRRISSIFGAREYRVDEMLDETFLDLDELAKFLEAQGLRPFT